MDNIDYVTLGYVVYIIHGYIVVSLSVCVCVLQANLCEYSILMFLGHCFHNANFRGCAVLSKGKKNVAVAEKS